MKRSMLYKLDGWLFFIAGLGILFELAMIGNLVHFRIDTTQDKEYTLSDNSKNLVRGLDEPLNLTLFVSDDMVVPHAKYAARYMQDLLKEYQILSSKIHLHVELITDEKLKFGLQNNPEKDNVLLKELERFKIEPFPVGEKKFTQGKQAMVFLGVGVEYGGKIDSLPSIASVPLPLVEYKISRAIRNLVVKRPKVAFGFVNNNAKSSNIHYLIQQTQEKGYDVIEQDLSQDIPVDVDVLILVGPKVPLSDKQIYTLDQFLMRGKGVGLFLDGQVVDTSSPGGYGPTKENKIALDDWLSYYGMRVNSDLILEGAPRFRGLNKPGGPGCVIANREIQFAVDPAFLMTDSIFLRRESRLVMPFVSSIDKQENSSYVSKLEPIFLSPKTAYQRKEPGYRFLMGEDGAKEANGSFVLGYRLEAPLKSYVAQNSNSISMSSQGTNAVSIKTESIGSPRLIVVGGSSFLTDNYVFCMKAGIDFYKENIQAANAMIDYLAKEEVLTKESIKGVRNRAILEISETATWALKVIFVLGVPFIFVIFGVVRWVFIRGKRRRYHQELFAD